MVGFAAISGPMVIYLPRLRLPRIRLERFQYSTNPRVWMSRPPASAGHWMHVILFRHGPAGDQDPARWPSDVDRPLTPNGIERTRLAARGLARLVNEVAFILTSPYERARQTAAIVSETFDKTTVETLQALACGASPRGVLAAIEKFHSDRTVILVGHEPDLGMLAAALIGSACALPLKKAGACSIAFENAPRAGGGHLQWYVPPRILRRLAGKEVRAI